MRQIIGINIDKKLTLFSLIFMFLSIAAIYAITIYQASFELDKFTTLNEFFVVFESYLSETYQLIEIITVLFLILIVELELFYNTDNFDAYYVSLVGKKKYFNLKIISYLIVFVFYFIYLSCAPIIIYLIRFKTTKYFLYIIEVNIYYFSFFIFIFLLSYLFLVSFKNYFSAMVVFLYYWFSKLLEQRNLALNIIFPKIILDVEHMKVGYETKNGYILIMIVVLLFLSRFVYLRKDLKVHS